MPGRAKHLLLGNEANFVQAAAVAPTGFFLLLFFEAYALTVGIANSFRSLICQFQKCVGNFDS